MTILTHYLMGGGCPEVNISDLVYQDYISHWRIFRVINSSSVLLGFFDNNIFKNVIKIVKTFKRILKRNSFETKTKYYDCLFDGQFFFEFVNNFLALLLSCEIKILNQLNVWFFSIFILFRTTSNFRRILLLAFLILQFFSNNFRASNVLLT